MSHAPELLLCTVAAALAVRAARRERGPDALLWWLLATTSLCWLGGRLLSPLVGIAAYAVVAVALAVGFRSASRGGLARRLVDLSAVAIAIGGAGVVLAVGRAETGVATAYAVAGTL